MRTAYVVIRLLHILQQASLPWNAGGQSSGVSQNLWDRLRGARAAYRGLEAEDSDVEAAAGATAPGPVSSAHHAPLSWATPGELLISMAHALEQSFNC